MSLSAFLPALPEIFVLVMVSLILVIDAAVDDSKRYLAYVLSLATLAGAAFLTVRDLSTMPVLALNGLFIDDPLSDVLKLFLYLTVAVVLVYSRDYLRARGLYKGEFFVLALFALLGMMVMVSASHFLTLYLGLELLSLSLYAMVALQRDSSIATEAAMKYFVLGALASGMLLYGMSMVYGVTGSLALGDIAIALQDGTDLRIPLVFGIVFIVAGLAFKLGAVPFHMWVPDVYHGAPTAMTLFIGSAPKIAAFAFVIRILGQGLESQVTEWRDMLIILAVLSMVLGNFAAIAQSNLKRMFAYSTISHMGFMLLGILAGTQNGYGSAMFYVLVYALMSLGGFGMILLLSRAGFEADQLDDFKGLNRRSPWLAFLMLLLMFSMAGVPPTVGFYAKLSVLQAVVELGYVWLAVAAVLFSLVGAFYYLRIVKLMYFDAPHDTTPIAPSADARLIMSANGLAVLALGILPQPLMAICVHAIGASF
ncbi:MAG TPA: NADH-quinone oxidoreductase subunit NuoN [Thiobacillus sp.]|nr:MAG: NADH-quinone oxidoreductase subunit N [Hydrogenophilales bacterium 28-61-11]OYZ58265.1 MAG: NADH-quinone oxidoreductase subunit N [Hydrogenophilales bacterium 16-61-112]OZA47645.1 MAG: NADH-quinone oxidoreductase subunit N [Hydrogenophilales bacterium 17-61-76]HQT31500.1 NADH-quinone oxidoreductase subunit NuoN [Thiobacillus sp.]HQT71752.1 NADH-quinone oxidoreductase subunit NuoN [Thiobacillus sp.]